MGVSRKGLLATRDLASSGYQQLLAAAASGAFEPNGGVPSRGKGAAAAQDFASLFHRVYKK